MDDTEETKEDSPETLARRKNQTIIWLAGEVRRLRDIAFTDQLTQVENRQGLEQRRKAQDPNGPFTLLLLDIDRFKNINDTYGHAAGDAVLVKFAEELKNRVRAEDIVCRYGGEEFLIVFKEEDPLNIMRKFQSTELVGTDTSRSRGHLRLGMTLDNGYHLELTASGGITALAQGEDLTQAIARADQAMYHAKESGRDQILMAG